MKNVKCARCVRCGKEYEAVPNLTNCSCGGILDIVYDYDYIKAHFTKETLKNRVNPTMWRYRELLPVEDTTPDTPLRVGWSPLYEEPKLAEMLGLGRLWVKDDGINPTASLKDRASAMAVAKALVAKGVDCKRLFVVGFGNSKPVTTPSSSPENTRIEFVNAAMRGKPIGGLPIDGGGCGAGNPCKP